MRWALEDSRTRDGSRPLPATISISSSRTFGSITVPEAMTGMQLG